MQARLDAGRKISDAELSRLKALSIEHGFEADSVSIPSRSGMADRTPASVEKFRNLVAKFGFRFFDGRGTLTQEDSLNLYYQRDGHLNPRGYDFFAREIEKALRDRSSRCPQTDLDPGCFLVEDEGGSGVTLRPQTGEGHQQVTDDR